eukprot:scaffold6018_cov51-Phaeocystis_antarctica.AAC.3
MLRMVVTLDVSMLSGWLNADANCRVERGGRPDWTGHARGAGAHKKHDAHACDAGRVETQRLVERRRALRCRKEGILSGVRPARRCRAAERRRRKRYMQGKGPTVGVG